MKINNINVILGVNFNTDYNLSEVYRNNKDPNILQPLEWLRSEEGQEYISLAYDDISDLVRVLNSIHPVCYVRSRYIWLGYLKHCTGNLDSAIALELTNFEPDGAA